MSIPVHAALVPVAAQILRNLSSILEKGEAHARARGYEPAVLLQARLFPDMLPLVKQVQIACDMAKFGVARLSGAEAPKHADDETSFEQLRARIDATIAFVEGVPPEAFEGAHARAVEVPMRNREPLRFQGAQYLLHFVLPNLHFHVTTAYALLRHNGVELGKADFLGAMGA